NEVKLGLDTNQLAVNCSHLLDGTPYPVKIIFHGKSQTILFIVFKRGLNGGDHSLNAVIQLAKVAFLGGLFFRLVTRGRNRTKWIEDVFCPHVPDPKKFKNALSKL